MNEPYQPVRPNTPSRGEADASFTLLVGRNIRITSLSHFRRLVDHTKELSRLLQAASACISITPLRRTVARYASYDDRFEEVSRFSR